ncbi:MAG TPA: CAP domain-containing protein [Pyrinomonadaceae bacterium]|nr:CAP domain-containing protein [Pyrinomonadaceae bacterium]
MKVSRRDFLQSASTAIGVSLLDRTFSPEDLEKTIKEIRANLLAMINEERAVENVQTVVLDDLATEVATKHAWDMIQGEYTSHWGRDGLKPYHRYSFAGGTDATAENVSAADNTWSMKGHDLKQDTAYLHVRLYQEKPPHDGHRKTILAPEHTHVGIGIVVHELRLRLVELFVARYVQVKPMAREAKRGGQISFEGKVRPGYEMKNIEVFYEPVPEAPEIGWLRVPRSYALPNESRVLRRKIPPPYMYADGQHGTVEIFNDGSFAAPVKLYKNTPGIYTIVTWINEVNSAAAFPATTVCIKAS